MADNFYVNEGSFIDCINLTSIDFGNVFGIEGYAFKNCYRLETLNIPRWMFSINACAFEGCFNVDEIIINDTIIELPVSNFIGDDADDETCFVKDDGSNVAIYRDGRITDDGRYLKSYIIPETVEEVTEETPVVEKKVKVKSIKLNKKTAVVKKGRTIKLKAKFNPTNATNKNVTWKSSNKKIATVDKNGKVTAKKKGTCVITCTTKNGKKTAKCKVKVR